MSVIIIAQRGAVVNAYSGADSPEVKKHAENTKTAKNGKKNVDLLSKAAEHKAESWKISQRLLQIGEKARSARMKACNEVVEIGICPCCGKQRILNSHLCRDRLCPTCGYLLSVKRYNEMIAALEHIDVSAYDWRFMTLTVKNCAPTSLEETLSELAKGWDRFLKARHIKANIKGVARSIEITYNRDTGEFHPHMHVLTAFKRGTALTALQLGFFWRQAMHLNYRPIVDIEEPYCTAEKTDPMAAAIVESFKYAVKSKQVAEMPLSSFAVLTSAIKNKRLISYTGVIQKARRELGIKNDDKADTEVDNRAPTCCGKVLTLAAARWSFTDEQYHIIEQQIQA